MDRIRLTLPTTFNFQVTIPVRITDINYGGHLGNDSVLSLMHEARMRFLKHHGYSELELGGIGLIMSDVAIEFRQEAFFGDELQFAVAAADFTRIGFAIYYRVTKENDVLVAQGRTFMVCFDYDKRKVVAVPESVKVELVAGRVR